MSPIIALYIIGNVCCEGVSPMYHIIIDVAEQSTFPMIGAIIGEVVFWTASPIKWNIRDADYRADSLIRSLNKPSRLLFLSCLLSGQVPCTPKERSLERLIAD
jgi:hypothetical protein